MLKRSIIPGVCTGLLISLALVYPVCTIFSNRYIPNWKNPAPAIHNSLQIVSFGAAGIFFILGVITTALLVKPNSYKTATKSGALAGLSAMIIIHTLLLSPSEGMIRMHDALKRPIESGEPTAQEIASYASRLQTVTFSNIMGPLFLGAILGALVMCSLLTAYCLLRHKRLPRQQDPEQPLHIPNLLQWVESGRVIRWPDPTESTWKAGIISGLLLGSLIGIQALFELAQDLGTKSHEQGVTELLVGPGLSAAASWLSWLAPLIIIFSGVLVLALQRHPSSRYWSRVWACVIAGLAAALVFQLIFLNHVWRLNTPILHLYMFQEADLNLEELLPHTPTLQAVFIYAIPWAGLFGLTATALCLAFCQGVIYAWLVPLAPIFRRPVDIGRNAYNKIQRDPTQVLPVIWDVFRQEAEALEALAHLTIRAKVKKNDSVAQLAAAYHTAVVHSESANQAVQTVASVLEAHPDWRWRAEIGELYRLLRAALAARQVADIAIIAPPPKERTSSLPKPLTRALDHLANIIRTLKKYERVDDLGGRILFLNNALDAIDQAQDFVRQDMHDPSKQRTAYPEKQSLEKILNLWQTMILETIRSLRGRAELTATLETRRLPYADTLHLEMRVVNVGLNVAEDVRVQLVKGSSYQPTPGQDIRTTEILLPGDGRSLEFALTSNARPADGGDLRVVFDIQYNDSVDPQRQFKLADSVAFLDQIKPFQRIFPIPYVTGTPLRTKDMFVGRGDVLQFIREHLLGAYQNNVIVLHGQRRTGKTSILYQLERTLQDSHVCVLVDMQGKAARGLVDFMYSLADDITYTLENFDIEIDPPDRQDFEESPEFFFSSRFLRDVRGRLKGRSLLLMFDEFEELQARVQSGKLEPDIFPYLRNLMQHEAKVDFIFAGTHKLEELTTEYWSILFNIATYKKISFLNQEQVTRLITEPAAPYGLEYDPLAVRRIYSVTAGQPYFVQLVCHEMVSYHNATERNYLTTCDVETVLETIIERGEAHFKYIWAGALPQERWALLGATEHLAHAETITFAELAAWLRQQEHTKLDITSLPDVLAALERRDILMRTTSSSRRYQFKIDLVRRWILANRQSLRDTINA